MKTGNGTGRLGGRPRTRHGAALLAALPLLLAACGGGSTEDGSKAGGGERTLVVAKALDFASLDPDRAYCDSCQIYMTAVYETLIGVAVDDPAELLPRLASKWEASQENKVFTFTLNPDAKFSDGSPVEAKDVKWTWERLSGLKEAASFLIDGYTAIEAPDPATVTVTFPEPRSSFFATVTSTPMGIVNSDVASGQGKATSGPGAAETDQAEQWFLENSAGSGQYTLKSYTAGGDVVLTRNDKYWGETPKFPSIELKQVGDSASQVQQLQQGEVDIALEVSFDSLGQLEGDADIKTDVIEGFSQVYVSLGPGAAGPGASEVKDPRVREAIRSAIDYDKVIDNTLAGNGRLQASALPNGFLGTSGLPLPKHDPARAKELLAEAGKPGGFALKAHYPKITLYGVDFDVMMQTVRQSLSEVGIDVELNPMEPAQYSSLTSKQGVPMGASYFTPDNSDPSAYVGFFGLVKGSVIAGRVGGGKAGTPLFNPKEQALLAQALAAPADQQEGIYAQIGQEMINDAVVLPVVNPKEVRAYASDITGMHRSVASNLDLTALGLE